MSWGWLLDVGGGGNCTGGIGGLSRCAAATGGGASHLLWAQRPQSSRVSAIATHPYKGEIGASCPLCKMGKLGAVGFATYPWPDDIRALLVSNALSMPAGEMFGLAFFIITLYHCLPRLQAIIQTTDCSAASSAVNTGSSGSPQINLLVQWLFAALPPPASLQISGLWLPGLQNRMADELSRGDGVAAVLRAQRAGWRTLNVTPPVEAIALSLGFLREVSAESQRR